MKRIAMLALACALLLGTLSACANMCCDPCSKPCDPCAASK
jgi:hypothetical protein